MRTVQNKTALNKSISDRNAGGERSYVFRGAVVVVALLALSLGSSGASAQNLAADLNPAPAPESARFVVSGVVLDPSDAAIEGAKVTLHGRKVGNEPSTQTGPSGRFQFSGVTPESYEIEVQQEGFKILKSEVKVGSRSSAPLRLVLQLEDLHQEFTVTNPLGEVSSEPGENADIIRIDRQALDSLPTMDGDVLKAVKEMLGPGQSGSGDPVLIVDGVPVSEIGVPASAIQEVRINQNPYAAEYSAPGQNRIEIITKGGSPQYHGSLDVSARNYRLDARNAFAEVRSPERLSLFDGYFSGPIGKSRTTSFQFNVSRKQDDRESNIYALDPSGIISENFPNPQRSTYLLAGINRQAGDGNSLSVRYSYYRWSDRGEDVGGITLPEAATDNFSTKQYIYLSDRAVITPNLTVEFYARASTSNSVTRSEMSGSPSIIVLDAFVGGSGQTNVSQQRDYVQLTDTVSWSHNKNLFKAGINLPAISRWSSNDRTNFNGTFQFSTLQDYLQGIPFSFTQQVGTSQLAYWEKELGVFVQDEVRVRPNLSLAFGLRYDWQNYVPNAKNFAPRAAFAFAPGGSRKLVLRGGAGIFYQNTGSSPVADMLRFNGQTLRQTVFSNPSYPDPFSSGGVAQILPSSIVRFAPDLRLPFSLQFSTSVETQLQKSTTFTATYIGIRGFDMFRSRDINAPLPPLYLQRPDPEIGTLREIESNGSLTSDALKLAVRTKIGGYFSGMVQYSLERSDDDTAGINSYPANQYDLAGEWARSSSDAHHFLYFYGTFSVPKGINLGASLSALSGLPYTITTGTDIYGTTFANARPAGVPRNSMEGPGSATLNLRLSKTFSLTKTTTRKGKKENGKEGKSINLAVDAFNVLNRVNLSQPVGNLSSPFFGRSISAGPPRRLQLLMRFQF